MTRQRKRDSRPAKELYVPTVPERIRGMVHLYDENGFVGNFNTRKDAEDRANCYSDGTFYSIEYTDTYGNRVTVNKKANSTSRRRYPNAHFVQGGSPGGKSGGR